MPPTAGPKPTNLTLYSYFRSSSSWRVRICLNLKSIPHKTHAIHLVKGEQVADVYKEDVNLMGQVPALEYYWLGEKKVLTQSLAIIQFLEMAFPSDEDGNSNPSLLSSDLSERAWCLSFSEVINSGIQPLQNLNTCKTITAESGGALNGRQYGKSMMEVGLKSLEGMVLKKWGLKTFAPLTVEPPASLQPAELYSPQSYHCLGIGPTQKSTIADACLIPQLYNARRFEVDLSPYPCLQAIEKTCLEEEAFLLSSPDYQEDCDVFPGTVNGGPEKRGGGGKGEEPVPKKSKH